MKNPSETEMALIADFEQQRHQRLLSILIPGGLILLGLAILGGLPTLLLQNFPRETVISLSITSALAVALLVAWLMLRRNDLALATNIFLIGVVTGILGLVAELCLGVPFSDQSLIQLACLDLVVILASAVSHRRAVIFAGLAESLVIALILLFVRNGLLAQSSLQHRMLLLIGILTYHWAIILLLIVGLAALQTSLRTLQEKASQLAQAQQIDALKDQFITQVNHELRTPIMSLQGYVDLIAALEGSLSPEDRQDMLVNAQKAGEHLIQFVNDVLDTRRVEQDMEFDRVPVPVRPLVAEALLVIPPLEQRPITMHIPGHLVVWGDATRLLQVLTNLLMNAIKYSPPGTPIEITAMSQQQVVEISVKDYGLGIPPDQVSALFHRFVRLERDIRSPIRGTGVGLFLCRMYITAMQGTIDVESSGIPGEGSRFFMRLPLFEGAIEAPGMTPTHKLKGLPA